MEKPAAQPKTLSEKAIGERAITLAHDLETKAASTAMDEVHAYKKSMTPTDYASMVRSAGSLNKFDREQKPSLPQIIITDNGGDKANISGVVRDVVDPKPASAELTKPQANDKQRSAQSDGNYSNTTIGIEKLWRDFFH